MRYFFFACLLAIVLVIGFAGFRGDKFSRPPILLLNGSPVTLLFTYYQWMMVFAAIPLAMYNGERGNSPRWLFYWFYPAHVYLLWALGALLLG